MAGWFRMAEWRYLEEFRGVEQAWKTISLGCLALFFTRAIEPNCSIKSGWLINSLWASSSVSLFGSFAFRRFCRCSSGVAVVHLMILARRYYPLVIYRIITHYQFCTRFLRWIKLSVAGSSEWLWWSQVNGSQKTALLELEDRTEKAATVLAL